MSYSVLLVDDEYMILEGLKRIIPWEDLGFEVVHTARRGADALSFLDEHSVDLLITDVSMPGMTGIAMLRELKSKKIDIKTMILSGYQEFEYVKEGIELGIKGYLLKPVDKDELKKKVLEIRQTLDDEKKEQSKEQLYNEMILVRWLNDELNEAEYLDFIEHFDLEGDSIFSVIVLAHNIYTEEALTYSINCQQELTLIQEENNLFYTTIIYHGLKTELNPFITGLKELMGNQDYQLAVGEAVSDWENVYESYEQAMSTLNFSVFYGDAISIEESLDFLQTAADSSFEFISFNKALMVGDLDDILSNLHEIFKQMAELHFSPDSVRHIVFLLFTDIYREYPSLNVDIYDETLKRIQNSKNIQELETWLSHVLVTSHEQPDTPKRYSEIVQQALDIIDKDYQDNLTLKHLSEELHVNSVYLGQLFKKETGRSFAQMLNQMRIKKSQDLLMNSHLTVNEIAYEIGYNNTTYFTKMFRKLNAMTPKEYRDKYS